MGRKVFNEKIIKNFYTGNKCPSLEAIKNNRFSCNPQLLLFASRDKVIFFIISSRL